MKNFCIFFFTLFFSSFSIILFAQNQQLTCGFDQLHNEKINTDANYKISVDKTNQQIYDYLTSNTYKLKNRSSGTLVIPTVVHIIHYPNDSLPGMGTNISNAQVLAGIQNLNDAFKNVGPYDSTSGVDTEIQFCLAARKPNGDSTNGIVRYSGNPDHSVNPLFESTNSWDTYNYLNIYVWLVIPYAGPGGFLAGYAFPMHGDKQDGVGVISSVFGYGYNTVPAHEVGHYLYLDHTFAGGCINNNCLTDGDKVCDTPPDNEFTIYPNPCSATQNSCNTDTVDTSVNNPFRSVSLGGLGDQNDPTLNYMDYVSWSCSEQFTQGQKDRMRANLLTVRSSLLQSKGCIQPCSPPVVVNGSYTLSPNNSGSGAIEEGDTLFFYDFAQNATNYQWYLNGSAFTLNPDSSYYLNAVGLHKFKICAGTIDTNCTHCNTISIQVGCSIINNSTANKLLINRGESVIFTSSVSYTNMQSSPTTYQWLVNSVVVGTTPNLTYQFNSAGIDTVISRICNGVCCTDKLFYITVNCNDKIDITSISDTYISPGDSVHLSNNSLNANNYKWYINDSLVSTAQNFNEQFDRSGAYWIKLIGNDGFCNDSSYSLVQVKGCNDKEGNNWCFANGNWLNFKDSLKNLSGGVSYFGNVGTISDVDGNLLLYSDLQLHNRFHETLANSYIGNAYTHINYENTTLIIRKPGSGHIYYYIEAVNDPPYGGYLSYKYKTVDIGKNRGKGRASTNDFLITTHKYPAISAVNHCNERDVWLITKDKTTGYYHSFLVSDTGVSTQPVISAYSGASTNYTFRFAKFSPDGKHLVGATSYNDGFELFDFDNSTGKLSNYRKIDSTTCYYEMEFSASGKYLYGACGGLYQFDLSLLTQSAITNSKFTIDNNLGNPSLDHMQIGIDKKIYITKWANNYTTSLSIINSPDSTGSLCNFSKDVFPLPKANKGLPQFNQSYFASKNAYLELSSIKDTICQNTNVFINVESHTCNQPYFNYFLPAGAEINQVTDTGVYVSFANSGINYFAVEIQSLCDTVVDSIYLFVKPEPILNIGNDTTICSPNFLTISANQANSYLWSTNATTQSITVNTSGTYWVDITGVNGCSNRDSLVLTVQICTEIEENGINYLTVTPNPSDGNFEINFLDNDKWLLTLTDIKGKVVFEERNVSNSAKINLSDISSGIYILKVVSGNKQGIYKLIKN